MQLSRKQTILIAVLSGLVLLLAVAAALLFTPGDGEGAVEPTPTPAETATPALTPAPTDTPEPTSFRLPLVPLFDTPRPTAEPTGTGVFAPYTAPPAGAAVPWVGTYDEYTRDILAVGLREGRAAVLLFLRLDKSGLALAALPMEETPLAGDDLAAKGAQGAILAEELTGRRYGAWLALDLGCVPAVLEITGPLSGQGAEVLLEDGERRAQGALSLMMGAARYMERVSLLRLPALKRAAGDSFASNLTTRELWSLFWTIRGGVAVRGLLLPDRATAGGRQTDLSALRKFFGESS